MSLSLSIKAARLLLTLSVSLWLAGGCLLGCSNSSAMGGEMTAAEDSHASHVAKSEDSCHAARVHDCCTRQKSHKRVATKKVNPSKEVLALAGVPAGMSKDCPLAMNATAVTSKSSGNALDPGRGPVAVLPRVENLSELTHISVSSSYLPNRGPTHLRCCVFLI